MQKIKTTSWKSDKHGRVLIPPLNSSFTEVWCGFTKSRLFGTSCMFRQCFQTSYLGLFLFYRDFRVRTTSLLFFCNSFLWLQRVVVLFFLFVLPRAVLICLLDLFLLPTFEGALGARWLSETPTSRFSFTTLAALIALYGALSC